MSQSPLSPQATGTDIGSPTQYFSQFQPFSEQDAEEVVASTLSPVQTQIPYPPPPTTFSWPAQVPVYIDELYRQQFHHRPRVHNPFFFTNGTNGLSGRDTYEVYALRLPKHPNQQRDDGSLPKVESLPDWEAFYKVLHAQKQLQAPTISTATTATTTTTTAPAEYSTPKFASHSAFPTLNDSVVVVSWFHAGPFACGPPGYVHGGLLSAIADTLMYETVLESERKAVTASLNLTFKSPTPINSLICVVASVELTGERKAFARCAIFSEDFNTLHAEATGVFVTPTAWVGLKGDLEYGIKNNTKFDNSKPQDQQAQDREQKQ